MKPASMDSEKAGRREGRKEGMEGERERRKRREGGRDIRKAICSDTKSYFAQGLG